MYYRFFSDDARCVGATGAYTELEYVGFGVNQYIDTGFVPNQDTRVITKARILETWYDRFLFGASGGNWDWQAFEFSSSGGCVSSGYAYYGGQTGAGLVSGDIVEVDFNKNVINYKINGVSQVPVSFGYQSFAADPMTLHLGATKRGTSGIGGAGSENTPKARVNFYATQIYDNGTLIRDFVPVRRNSDGVAGMYDRVEDKFYGIGGTAIDGVQGDTAVGCVVCGEGTYNSIGADVSCVACPTGYGAPSGVNASDHDSINGCTARCEPGYYVASVGAECTPVPAGYYAPVAHNVKYGEISSDVGGVLQCPSGQTSSVGARSCVGMCNVGTGLEYTILEYIRFNGNRWIDTGVLPNYATRVVTKVRFNDTINDYTTALGARESGYGSLAFEFYLYDGYPDTSYGVDVFEDGLTRSFIRNNDVVDIDFNKNVINYKINGAVQPSITRVRNTFSVPSSLALGGTP